MRCDMDFYLDPEEEIHVFHESRIDSPWPVGIDFTSHDDANERGFFVNLSREQAFTLFLQLAKIPNLSNPTIGERK